MMIHAVDHENGQRITLLGVHPRKELLEELNAKHADKIYRDKADGRIVHVGYIVAGCWWTFYTVEPWEREA